MGHRPVIVRLLDAPLHEFLPHEPADVRALAKEMGVSATRLRAKIEGPGRSFVETIRNVGYRFKSSS